MNSQNESQELTNSEDQMRIVNELFNTRGIRPIWDQERSPELDSDFSDNASDHSDCSDKAPSLISQESEGLTNSQEDEINSLENLDHSWDQDHSAFDSNLNDCASDHSDFSDKAISLISQESSVTNKEGSDSLMQCNSKEVHKQHSFVDSHSHLHWLFDRENFKGSFAEFRERNRNLFPEAFEGCVNVFCHPDEFIGKECYEDLLNEDLVYGAFGCHPRNAHMFDTIAENHLLQRLQLEKVVALGEIGLDYSNTFPDRDKQKSVFRTQLKIAIRLDKPIVIHSRYSDDDALEILKELVPHDHLIHRHCYTGNWENLFKWISHFPNLFVGFTNLISSPSVSHLHAVAKNIPLQRILLETDTPFFLPYNLDSTANYRHSNPGMAIYVASKIASCRGRDPDIVEDVLKAARENTKKIYGF